MQLAFVRDGMRGEVNVTIDLVEHAAAIGKPAGSEGFPCCQATVSYPGRGYRALFGWVQLVRSADFAGNDFALDPLRFFEGATSPHCLYGFCPTLFDAPSRDTRDPLDWIAHSFLAPIELFIAKREVRPVLGFSWGFDIDTRSMISLKPTEVLSAEDWEQHLDYLSDHFPNWTFAGW